MFGPQFETPLQRLIREALEEQERKKRLENLSLFGLLGNNPTPSVLGNPFLYSTPPKKDKVFVSFDYDNDKNYKYLLGAWSANPRFEFTFDDVTPGEIDTNSIPRIKQALANKIALATHTLVIVGRYANSFHKHSQLIGHRNWINFEVYYSKLCRNKIVAIKLNREYTSPVELLDSDASWAMSFTKDAIIKALEQA